jgi:two-component system phosphate regulon response regulator PhoB
MITVKPFGIAELLARMRALLRRTRAKPERVCLELGDLAMDLTAVRVARNGRDVHLGQTEFRLLNLLMHSPNRVFTREEILDRIWGADCAVEARSVDVYVRRLREAITREGEPDVVRTVRGSGPSTNRLTGLNSFRFLRSGSINGSPCQSLEVLCKLEHGFLGVGVAVVLLWRWRSVSVRPRDIA